MFLNGFWLTIFVLEKKLMSSFFGVQNFNKEDHLALATLPFQAADSCRLRASFRGVRGSEPMEDFE